MAIRFRIGGETTYPKVYSPQEHACVKVFSNFKKASGYGIIRQFKVEDLVAVEGYTLRVEDPIDSAEIDGRLKGHLYDTPMDFVRDMRHMAANVLRFDVTIFKDRRERGRHLLRWVDERLSQELPGHVETLPPETLACLDILEALLDGAKDLALMFWNRIDVVLQAAGLWDEYLQVIDYPCDFGELTTQLVVEGLPAEVFLGRAERVCRNAEHFWTLRNQEQGLVEAARTLRHKLESTAQAHMPMQWGCRRWWDDKLERRVVLHRAISLHKAYTTQRDQPTSQVPTYLEARVAAGHAVPGVEVVSPQSEHETEGEEEAAGESGKKEAAGERGDAQGAEAGEEETRHAMLEYVVKGLNEELVTELLEGFHGRRERVWKDWAEERGAESDDGEDLLDILEALL